jgi:hypothetical protein
MSGDCLCGAYAKPGELAEVGLFYPTVAARLRALQDEAKAAGIGRCTWGAGKQPGDGLTVAPGRLCSTCVEIPGQVDVLEEWLGAGLLTEEQYVALARKVPTSA